MDSPFYFESEATEMAQVKFYMSKWWRLDNFAATSFNGWPTVEHAYQAAKFEMGPGETRTPEEYKIKESYRKMIRTASDPGIAKALAHTPQALTVVRPDWDDAKVDIMRQLLWAKVRDSNSTFVLHDLCSTGDAEIVEDSPKDAFWGRGPDGNGQNMLGKLWMEIRAQIQMEQADRQTESGA
ncbi:MAG: NADAR family protein [Candidatus Nomurabacteria bacterium]|jgi:ribA/ribD-fused uncharacterized protein|nr:NADAR family protein [Candidatus Nomurabacteria bacterium]